MHRLGALHSLPYLNPYYNAMNTTITPNKTMKKCIKNPYNKYGKKRNECIYSNWELDINFNYTSMINELKP